VYGTARKSGVGFNAPLILEGRQQRDWRRWYDFARQLTRLRNRRPWVRLPASTVEAMREYRK
jgi:hypothetical protein